MTDWATFRRVSDPDGINEALRGAGHIKASPAAMVEMRRRFPSPDPPPPYPSLAWFTGTPIDVDDDVPAGCALAGAVLLDFLVSEPDRA